MFLVLGLSVSWAQGESGQQPSGNAPPPADSVPAPAFGQDNPPPQTDDNPPLSGLDSPSLEPHTAARSFLLPSAHLVESVDSNLGGTTGNSAIHGVTRALGSVMLQRIWRHYETALDYTGGAAVYSGFSKTFNQVHQLMGEERILWRTGQLALRDSFRKEHLDTDLLAELEPISRGWEEWVEVSRVGRWAEFLDQGNSAHWDNSRESPTQRWLT